MGARRGHAVGHRVLRDVAARVRVPYPHVSSSLLPERRSAVRRSIVRHRLKVAAVVGGSGGLLLLGILLYLFTDLFFNPPQGVASQPRAGDWAMFGRNLAHTGAKSGAKKPLIRF